MIKALSTRLGRLDMDSDDENSVPDCLDFNLEGDDIERDPFIDHPPPTKLEFDDFDEDVLPLDELS